MQTSQPKCTLACQVGYLTTRSTETWIPCSVMFVGMQLHDKEVACLLLSSSTSKTMLVSSLKCRVMLDKRSQIWRLKSWKNLIYRCITYYKKSYVTGMIVKVKTLPAYNQDQLVNDERIFIIFFGVSNHAPMGFHTANIFFRSIIRNFLAGSGTRWNKILLIAFINVKGETMVSSSSFLVTLEGTQWVIKTKSLHVFCIRLVIQNFIRVFKNVVQQKQVVNMGLFLTILHKFASNSSRYVMTKSNFNYYYNRLCKMSTSSSLALIKSQRQDERKLWGQITTNLAKAINLVLRKIRNLPKSVLVITTYYICVKLFAMGWREVEFIQRFSTRPWMTYEQRLTLTLFVISTDAILTYWWRRLLIHEKGDMLENSL
ncbi:hypothetical protein CR513_53637, partial [Mucuna pruriens]